MTKFLPDAAILAAVHPSNASGKPFAVTYSDGTDLTVRARNRDAAVVFAREYGIRFLAGAQVRTLHWLR